MLDRNEQPTFNPNEINPADVRLIVFQPEPSFYTASLQDRLAILEKKLNEANSYLQNNPSKVPAIFVGPEYLFKDASKSASERYYSHDQKNSFINTMKELSQKYENMIIVPGTFCWTKQNKKDNKFHFRNTAYLFFKGEYQQYKKTHRSMDDNDYFADQTYSGNDERLNYFNINTGKAGDEPVKIINELTIGINICLDNKYSDLEKFILEKVKDKKIVIQLIIADGLTEDNHLSQPDLLYAHIEKEEKNSLIGVVKETGFAMMPTVVEQDYQVDKIDSDLRSYRFK